MTMTHIIITQHIQIALFGIKFGVAPDDGRRLPKHIGEETVLLYAYTHTHTHTHTHIYIYIYIYIYNQAIDITKRKVPTFQAPAAV